ncbi:MAG: FISUMP domain-containing protein, partial [Bacteroidia bacterium]
NESGFNGLPGGYRDDGGAFVDVGENGNWWSSTEYDTKDARSRYLSYNFGFVFRYFFSKEEGFSVRCLRD